MAHNRLKILSSTFTYSRKGFIFFSVSSFVRLLIFLSCLTTFSLRLFDRILLQTDSSMHIVQQRLPPVASTNSINRPQYSSECWQRPDEKHPYDGIEDLQLCCSFIIGFFFLRFYSLLVLNTVLYLFSIKRFFIHFSTEFVR